MNETATKQETLQRIAEIDPAEWAFGDGWKCVEFIQALVREALATDVSPGDA